MGDVIAIASGKGGVGKTLFTANAGAALASLKKSVALVDADIGLRNLDLVMGMESRVKYTSADVAEGKVKLKHALIRDSRYSNLYVLPAPQQKNCTNLRDGGFQRITAKLAKVFDYVLIDCPAGIENGFSDAAACAEKIIIVTLPEITAVRDADRGAKLLRKSGKRDLSLVVNRINYQYVKEGIMFSGNDVSKSLGLPLLGVIPDDYSAALALGKGELLDKGWLGGTILDTARRITGNDVPLRTDNNAAVNAKGKFSLFNGKKWFPR